MKSAVVTVMTLDASGQSVPVAFRSAASAEAESFLKKHYHKMLQMQR
ncbi:hypothetical protein P4S63_01420 [Pseudoalteromonas sp. B193]